MNKKLFSIVFGLLMISLAIPGVVLAAPSQQNEDIQNGRREYGELLALSEMGFRMKTPGGFEIEYLVDEMTRYVSKDRLARSFDDLKIGSKVLVFASRKLDGDFIAKIVIILPDDFRPGNWMSVRAKGEVSEVDLEGNTLTIIDSEGKSKRFTVDPETRFRGQGKGLDEIQEGWVVVIFGQEQEDGGLLARLILSAEHLPRKRLAGRVSQVRIEDNSFTLDLRNGAEIEVLVDENTGFHSRDGNIQRIEDLKEGMVAIIVFQPQINGERLAVNVFASEAENLPRFDLRINGEITGIGDNSIEVKTKLGGLYTFAFGSETRVFDRDWKEYEVNSLEVGMQIKLGGIKLDDGSILAKLILIPSQK